LDETKENDMMKQGMKPIHPGQILKEMYLEPLNLNQTDASANLGLNMQRNYDLWNAGQRIKLSEIKVFRKPRNASSKGALSHF